LIRLAIRLAVILLVGSTAPRALGLPIQVLKNLIS
jgi:hypothetical protein